MVCPEAEPKVSSGWQKFYSDHKFAVDVTFCVTCFGAAVLLARRMDSIINGFKPFGQ